MGTRKLVRDIYFTNQSSFRHILTYHQDSPVRLYLFQNNSYPFIRSFSVFNEFSKQVKGKINTNPEFHKSVKELKQKAWELKDDFKERTKRTSEHLYKHVDGVWTEAEAAAKKVSENVTAKISAVKSEVKETLGNGKTQSSEHSHGPNASGACKDDTRSTCKDASSEGQKKEAASSDSAETLYGKFKSTMSSASPVISAAFQKIKEAKVVDFAKKGLDVVKDELMGIPRKKHMQRAPAASTAERSAITDIIFVPTKQSAWSKKWDTFKEKMQGHPLYKRIGGLSEPVLTKGQEFAEDMRERWETTENPVVHKIQDLNESVFGETHAALSIKEIRRRDPSFSLPEFVAEVQDVVKPVLNAYVKGDIGTLNKYCSPEVIERCKAERRAYEIQDVFFDNKVLHISELEVRGTKLMGNTPIIILAFQTQQVYCARDKNGLVKEGGKDTIHTVYYAWAMQQTEEDGSAFPIWRLREVQQLGVQALI